MNVGETVKTTGQPSPSGSLQMGMTVWAGVGGKLEWQWVIELQWVIALAHTNNYFQVQQYHGMLSCLHPGENNNFFQSLIAIYPALLFYCNKR